MRARLVRAWPTTMLHSRTGRSVFKARHQYKADLDSAKLTADAGFHDVRVRVGVEGAKDDCARLGVEQQVFAGPVVTGHENNAHGRRAYALAIRRTIRESPYSPTTVHLRDRARTLAFDRRLRKTPDSRSMADARSDAHHF